MRECADVSMDLKTPRNVYLSAFYKRSFAYRTVKYRFPAIITQLVDLLYRQKDEIIKQHKEGASEDIKKAIIEISKLLYEFENNRPLVKLESDQPDVKIYNDYIDKQATEEGEVRPFNTIWLLTECYMYRKIKEIFYLTKTLKDFDYFQALKQEAFNKSIVPIKMWCDHVSNLFQNSAEENARIRDTELLKLLQVSLWGNKCDLSISLGVCDSLGSGHDLEELAPCILVNDSQKFLETIVKDNQKSHYIDIVLDNAGYELFTDLCLLTGILLCVQDPKVPGKSRYKVRIHMKMMPWFISDVNESDFHWTLEQLAGSKDPNMSYVGKKWKDYLDNGTFEIMLHSFWTYPYEFKYMEQFAPDLYDLLQTSAIIIFKGDLNYRKLFGETYWDPLTPPKEALRGFLPSNLIAARTIKADIVCGLKPGVVEECEAKNAKWMEAGDYGLIQFVAQQ